MSAYPREDTQPIGLLSPSEFESRITATLNRATDAPPAKLLILGFGGLDQLVGELGTEGATAAMREVCGRLSALFTEGILGAQIFGDRFAVLIDSGFTSTGLTARLLASLKPSFCFRGEEIHLQPRFGVAATQNASNARDLIRRATAALQRAESSGGLTPALYETKLMPLHAADPALSRDLEPALNRGEIKPWLQPIWRLSDGALVAVEALARWEHPSRGLIMPDTFLPLARRAGLLAKLDAAVRCQAMAWLSKARAHSAASRDITIAVNVADADLLDPELLDTLQAELEQHQLPASAVHLELSERAQTATTPEVQGRISRIAAAGFSWHLDDFGTGHSNIQRLRGLPFSVVKLDRSMLRGLGRDHHAEHLLKPMIALARVLNLEVIAEGVERPEQLQTLKRLGCDMAQGYHLSPPRPAPAIEALLAPSSAIQPAAQAAASADAPHAPGHQ